LPGVDHDLGAVDVWDKRSKSGDKLVLWFYEKQNSAFAMPRLMLMDEHWSKLKLIILESGIYEKSNLRTTLEGVLYKLALSISDRLLIFYDSVEVDCSKAKLAKAKIMITPKAMAKEKKAKDIRRQWQKIMLASREHGSDWMTLAKTNVNSPCIARNRMRRLAPYQIKEMYSEPRRTFTANGIRRNQHKSCSR
jgi:hypothetical protein